VDYYLTNEFAAMATLSLPGGSYWVRATIVIGNDSGADVEAVCELSGGPISGAVAESDLSTGFVDYFVWFETLSVMTYANLTAPTTVSLACEAAPIIGNVYPYYPQMAAIPVTTITYQ